MAAGARHRTRLLFTSTSEVYGKCNGRPLHEHDDRIVGSPAVSRWSYATTKAFGEILAHEYARARREDDGRAPLQRGRPAAGERLRDGSPPVGAPGARRRRSDGVRRRQPVALLHHVRDTVDALVDLIDTDAAIGNVYNVGSSDQTTILDLATRVLERTGSSSRIRLVPYEEAYSGGFEELGNRRPDCSAIERLIGWRPRRSVDDAIDDVIAGMTAATGYACPPDPRPRPPGHRQDEPGRARPAGGAAQRAAPQPEPLRDPPRPRLRGRRRGVDGRSRPPRGARAEFVPSLSQPRPPSTPPWRGSSPSPVAFAPTWSIPTWRRPDFSRGWRAHRPAAAPVIVHTYHGHVLEGYFGPTKSRLYRSLETGLGRAAIAWSASARRPSTTWSGSGSRAAIASR